MNKKIILVLVILSIFSTVFMILAIGYKKDDEIIFVPPSFEKTVQLGKPSVEEQYGWTEINQEGIGFITYLCGNLFVYDTNKTDIYLTNLESNEVWIKLRVYNEDNEIIAETGLIKPGEYVKSIQFNKKVIENEKVKMKIMAYEPNTYYSEGSIVLNTYISSLEVD